MQTLSTITNGTASAECAQPMSAPMSARTVGFGRTSLIGTIGGLLEEVLLLLLAVFLLPAGILLVGAPIALCVRVVLEIVRWL